MKAIILRIYLILATYRDAGIRYIRNIMAFIHTDKNDQLVLATVDHLADVYKAKVTLIRFSSNTDSAEKKSVDADFLKDLAEKQQNPTEAKMLHGDDELKTVLAETMNYDLFILGSSDHTFINSLRGTYDDKLIAKASCSVLAVHSASNI